MNFNIKMMYNLFMKTIAILGPTASGKTDLSIRLAKETDAVILSLDSLCLYKEIEIASAKPTKDERRGVKHFGIDVVNVDFHFNVSIYASLFNEAKQYAQKRNQPLIIVGGTGFYLKTLMRGLSDLPPPTENQKELLSQKMENLQEAYLTLASVDEKYAESISRSDSYRIEKGLQIYFQTGKPPTEYFKNNPPKPLLESVVLYEIKIEKDILQKRIESRTEKMFEAGLVDEVAELEYHYGRAPNPMKAIGIKEILDYFDGKFSFEEAKRRVVIHTRQLAKRQLTFNKTQFPRHKTLGTDEIFDDASSLLIG